VRGSVPTDSAGNPLTFADYDQAKWHLVNRFGPFCAYCERRLATHINVEHIAARSTGGPVVDWDNFLLACQNCNSAKQAKPITNLYFPHAANTSYAFAYRPDAIIQPNSRLTTPEQEFARKTLELFGLHNLQPSAPGAPDRRYDDYLERWGMAEVSRNRLKRNDTVELREQIADTVHDNGAFSIYLAVFESDKDMRLRIVERFNNVERSLRRNCFTSGGDIIPDLNI
jgi:hypothetical protein